MDDEFDRALMTALNETVPLVAISPGMAERLVARAHRRSKRWKLFLASLAVSAVFGAVWTASELADNAADDDGHETAGATQHLMSNGSRPDGSDATSTSNTSPPQPITTPTTGETKVNTPRLKSAAAVAGAIALATAQPTSAAGDDYQFIVSGYPAANPKFAARSATTGLETGSYRIKGDADDLEARYRTRELSNATALRSDEFKAMIIIIK